MVLFCPHKSRQTTKKQKIMSGFHGGSVAFMKVWLSRVYVRTSMINSDKIFRSGFRVKKQSVIWIPFLSYSYHNSHFLALSTSTMTLQEQALESGLVFRDCEDVPVPQWNAKDWPRLLGDWRFRHASVVINHPDKENTQTVVVLGGTKENQAFTNSVLVLNLDPNEEKKCGWKDLR